MKTAPMEIAASVGALAFGLIRGAKRASRILHAIGDRIPGLSGDRLEQALLDAAESLSALGRDRRTLVLSLTWATLNFDADPQNARRKLGPILDPDDPDLSRFRERGGKLIVYHGWGDQMVPAETSSGTATTAALA